MFDDGIRMHDVEALVGELAEIAAIALEAIEAFVAGGLGLEIDQREAQLPPAPQALQVEPIIDAAADIENPAVPSRAMISSTIDRKS